MKDNTMTNPTNEFISRCTTGRTQVSALRAHPQNPRKDLGDLTELTDSIREKGITQTVLVMPHPTIDGDYQILIGHRRVAAARAAGFDTIAVNIAPQDLTEAEQMEIMLTENLQRSDLKPSEEIAGVQALFDMGKSATQVAKGIGKSVSTVQRYKKMSGAGESAKTKLDDGQLTADRLLKIAEFNDHPELARKLEDEATGYNFEFYYRQAQQKVEDETFADAAREKIEALGIRIFADSKEANDAGYTDYLGSRTGGLPHTAKEASEFTAEALADVLPGAVKVDKVGVILHEGSYSWRAADVADGKPAKTAEQLEAERVEAGLVKNLAAARKSFSDHVLHRVQHPKTLNKAGFAQGLALVMTGQSNFMQTYAHMLGFEIEGTTYRQAEEDFFSKASAQPFEKLFAAMVAASMGVSSNYESVSARELFELRSFNPSSTGHSEAVRSFSTAEKLFDWASTPAETAALNFYQPAFEKMYTDNEVNF